ncbi:MAG: hypothetical protein ACMXYG_04245 [Candidatus Woesearchaeota archaeon]
MHLYDPNKETLQESLQRQPNHRLEEIIKVYGPSTRFREKSSNKMIGIGTFVTLPLIYAVFNDPSENFEVTKFILKSPITQLGLFTLIAGYVIKMYNKTLKKNESEIYHNACDILIKRDMQSYERAISYNS